jgi:hypothetical protein
MTEPNFKLENRKIRRPKEKPLAPDFSDFEAAQLKP